MVQQSKKPNVRSNPNKSNFSDGMNSTIDFDVGNSRNRDELAPHLYRDSSTKMTWTNDASSSSSSTVHLV
jgi:hypothetical protein